MIQSKRICYTKFFRILFLRNFLKIPVLHKLESINEKSLVRSKLCPFFYKVTIRGKSSLILMWRYNDHSRNTMDRQFFDVYFIICLLFQGCNNADLTETFRFSRNHMTLLSFLIKHKIFAYKALFLHANYVSQMYIILYMIIHE